MGFRGNLRDHREDQGDLYVMCGRRVFREAVKVVIVGVFFMQRSLRVVEVPGVYNGKHYW